LVGLFYGYDFTVLRVFFTAGVTAMIGVIALAHFGLLDISLIYVNPTFLWSAIVGGLIMGLGFVIGGYCPGTSVCAAAIGKIDAMIFVAGSFLGVLVFAEGYPLFEDLYKAQNWGNVTIFSVFGMSQSLFAFLLIVVAVSAFWTVTFIENKVNGKSNPEFGNKPLYYGLTVAAILIALSAFILPDRKESILNAANNNNYSASMNIKEMSTDELAFRLMDDDKNVKIFDLRSPKEYAAVSLPKSANINYQNLFEKDIIKQLSFKNNKNIFVANDENQERKAAIISLELGFKQAFILKGGFNQFKEDILDFNKSLASADKQNYDTYRFRIEAAKTFPILIKEFKEKQNKNSAKTEKKRVLGGC
jgi:rhodanese-related sulfurtransferase